MKKMKWDTVVLNESEYDHLVAELHFGDQFLLLVDREDGRENICVAFPKKKGARESVLRWMRLLSN
ncbi:hypothetical protein PSE10B_51670 [Pseudomonas amygdali pv. eriobotryae]|nr:hypothetical protein [Pseudomonas amygdali]UPT39278.1 hypothetical protein LT107_12175 [Pseudomonas amygdali pv. loropetali]GFZ68645.1 hypothetical protein PSE10B_51670 [Pseudomonas amygdali pv. eriobotryae]